MRVENVSWLSKQGDAALVMVSDGQYLVEAYSQPCSVKAGDLLTDRLHLFGVRSAVLTERGTLGIHSIDSDGLAQCVIAKVENAPKGYLTMGGIRFVTDDPLPRDIENGDIITVECVRVDLW
jgi:hypothetical protein